jgi:hypothetical protein
LAEVSTPGARGFQIISKLYSKDKKIKIKKEKEKKK